MDNSRTPKIIIIESDEQLRNSLAWTLEQEGYTIRGFPDLESAHEELSDGGCDLVISDLFLYEMGEESVSRLLRMQPGDIPVLVIMAYPESELNNMAQRIFGNAYFNVTEEMERLRNSIHTMVPLPGKLPRRDQTENEFSNSGTHRTT